MASTVWHNYAWCTICRFQFLLRSFIFLQQVLAYCIIAPKASAEGACILIEVGYYGARVMGYYDCA